MILRLLSRVGGSDRDPRSTDRSTVSKTRMMIHGRRRASWSLHLLRKLPRAANLIRGRCRSQATTAISIETGRSRHLLLLPKGGWISSSMTMLIKVQLFFIGERSFEAISCVSTSFGFQILRTVFSSSFVLLMTIMFAEFLSHTDRSMAGRSTH